MRQVNHVIVGETPVATRYSDIMDPNNGGVQGRVALGMRRCWSKRLLLLSQRKQRGR